MGIFDKFKLGFKKSANNIASGLREIIVKKEIDDNTLDKIEEFLISSDVGVDAASEIKSIISGKNIDPNKTFNIGKIKKAPGTVASLVTCIIFLILINIFNIFFILLLTILIVSYFFIAINNSFDEFNSDDPQEIVMDEFVGQMLTLLAIPVYQNFYPTFDVYYCVFAFFLFRLFDILKPFPVNYVDKNIKGGFGIMLDDVVAAVYVIIFMTITFFILG